MQNILMNMFQHFPFTMPNIVIYVLLQLLKVEVKAEHLNSLSSFFCHPKCCWQSRHKHMNIRLLADVFTNWFCLYDKKLRKVHFLPPIFIHAVLTRFPHLNQ